MNDSADHPDQQKRLWRQYLAGSQPDSTDLSALDPNLLAAYLDGSAKLEQIEYRLASDPALLEELIELRQLCDLESTAVAPALLSRAKNLLSTQTTPSIRFQPAQPSLYTWWRRVQWAAAAAAVMLACLTGYSVGRITSHSKQRVETLVASNTSLDMEELISGPTLAISLPINGQNGR